MTADPRSVDGPAFTVRVRAGGGGITYTSGRMTKDDAEALATRFAADVSVASRDGRAFVVFPATAQETTRIRTERVSAIDVVSLHLSIWNDGRPGKSTRPFTTPEKETR